LRLAGLDTINFSADKYHLEFLAPSLLRDAIQIAQDSGYVAIVNFVVNEPGDPVKQFSRLYGIEPSRIRRFSEDEFAQQARDASVPPEMFTKINLSYNRLIGLGRAAQHPSEH